MKFAFLGRAFRVSRVSRACGLALGLLFTAHAPVANAQDANLSEPFDGWELTLSPYSYHFNRNQEYKHVVLVGLERHYSSNWLWGGALFSNSFGQPSGTVYFGYQWDKLFGVEPLYFKLVGGIMYGYVDEYEDKVPLNHNGFSPIILPGLGWRLTPKDALQVIVLGGNGFMFSYNRRF